VKTLKRITDFIAKHVPSFIGAVVFLAVVAVLFFNLFPFNVAEFKSITVKSDTTVGGILEYTNDYCQNVQKGTDRTLRRFLIPKDTTLVNPIELSSSPEDETQQGAGCRVSVPIKIPIDSNIPAGEYKLRVKACYDVFLRIRCVTVQGESDYFNVSKPNIESQLVVLNQKIDEVNARLTESGSPTVVNTLMIPTPQTITPPFQEPEPSIEPQPTQPVTPTPEQTCVINVIGIKLLCS